MPAYAKLSLVTSIFHPSDIAFARNWSEAAPGYDGWRVVLDRDEAPERVSILPPGAEETVFVVVRDTRDVILFRRRPAPSGELTELGRFDGLREAVLALCPLPDEALEEIHERLEIDFPRQGR
jgi:hypothetical protein